MHRPLIRITILIAFLIWILPLGVFIKPSMEEKACNGQRAICLCRHLMAKQLTKQGIPLLKNVSMTSNSFSSLSPDYLTPSRLFVDPSDPFVFHFLILDPYSFEAIASIDHVPKALFA